MRTDSEAKWAPIVTALMHTRTANDVRSTPTRLASTIPSAAVRQVHRTAPANLHLGDPASWTRTPDELTNETTTY